MVNRIFGFTRHLEQWDEQLYVLEHVVVGQFDIIVFQAIYSWILIRDRNPIHPRNNWSR